MLQILIAFLYSSCLCMLWGEAGIRLLRIMVKDDREAILHPGITALSGLVLIGIILEVLSLFTGLGGWVIQVVMLAAPVSYFLLSKQHLQFTKQLKNTIKELHPIGYIFLLACSLYVLLIGSWEIIHPDSIAYHIPIMDWTRIYRAVPGLVNINERAGYHSNWFLLAAFFSFDFTGTKALTFINSTLLLWTFYFLAGRISYFIRTRNVPGILTISILTLFCFGISTMFYLTAASVSPDFVVCVILWTAFYLSYTAEKSNSPRIYFWLAIILLFYVPAIKLSALPAWLFLAYLLIEKTELRSMAGRLLLIAFGVVVILPVCIRNVITSGYPLFPSTMLDVFDFDWKLPVERTIFHDRYITEYARVGAYADRSGYDPAEFANFQNWVPVWWQGLGIAGKCLLATVAVSIVLITSRIRRIANENQLVFWICVTCIAGTGLWLWKAPAPRFMQAFLVPLPVIAAWFVTKKPGDSGQFFRVSYALFTLIIAAVFGYDAYRISKYSEITMIIEPKGARKTQATLQNCNGTIIYRSTDVDGCGNSYFPCTTKECNQFEKRGPHLADGFRPVN